MSNPQPQPPATVRWWVVLVLGGLVLLMCFAPGSALMDSLLLISRTGVQSPACGGSGGTPLTRPERTAAASTLTGGCGIDPSGNVIVAWALAIAAHLYIVL
jgi:hypothetical protein